MEENQLHLLVVEDDEELAQWMCDYLSTKDFNVSSVGRGDDAVTFIKDQNPDVVILDGMLPGMDGLDVCKTVRPFFDNPIIMLTARDEEIDEVLGLEMGADDYLTKPVRARVLLTRIRKLIERNNKFAIDKMEAEVQDQVPEQLQFNNLIIDNQARVVSLNDEKIKISSNEFDVLWLLALKAGQSISRDDLVKQLRGFEYDGFDRSIDLRISRLRKKLGDDPSEPYRIKTIWGKGYLFAKDAW
jgi:DNA-binding response OmpR family regulator